jgi:parallel beta-helix repeat protein
MRTLVILTILLAFSTLSVAQTTWYVDDNNTSGPWNGTPQYPFQYIEDGISAAINGDTVLVLAGSYVENLNFLGKTITVKSEEGPFVTTIDGGQSGSVVAFDNGENLDSVLDGFTITNGSGTLIHNYFRGGGILAFDHSSPTIINNVIIDNAADAGAGIYCRDYSSPLIRNNSIASNTAIRLDGGGITCRNNSSPLIEDNVISGNTTSGQGGGIHCLVLCDPVIAHNDICLNSAAYGGGVICMYSSPTIKNNIVHDNSASIGGGISCESTSYPKLRSNIVFNNTGNFGGGIACYWNGNADIENNTIYGNTAQIQGGGIFCYEVWHEVTNTILWNNEAPTGPEGFVDGWILNPSILTISYSDVKGGQNSIYVGPAGQLNWGPGMIDSDPLFVDAANEDFHIFYASPCREAGHIPGPALPNEDFEKDPRPDDLPGGGEVDIGADEFYIHLYYTGNAAPGGQIQVKIVGLPGWSTLLWFGLGILDNPVHTQYGDWYLENPYPPEGIPLGNIPTGGVLITPFTIPQSPPGPYFTPMQALVGGVQLTNLSIIEIQ